MNIGERIRYFRKKAGLSQEKLADMLALSPSSISNYENDYRMPDYPTLKRLAEAVGTSYSELTDWDIPLPAAGHLSEGGFSMKDYRDASRILEDELLDGFRQLPTDDKYIFVGEVKKSVRSLKKEARASTQSKKIPE